MLRKLALCALLAAFTFVLPAIAKEKVPGPGGTPAPTVKFMAPAPGTIWQEGTSQTIMWKFDPEGLLPDSITIRMAKVNGKEVRIATIVKENPGEYTWMRVGPRAKATRLEIRAYLPKKAMIKNSVELTIAPKSDTEGGTIQSAVPPQISLRSPGGMERLAIGTTKTIAWTATLPESDAKPTYRIMLSRDGGKTFDETLAHNLSKDTKQYSWAVTGPDAGQCRIKVEVVDAERNVVCSDANNTDFAIASDVVKPANAETPR